MTKLPKPQKPKSIRPSFHSKTNQGERDFCVRCMRSRPTCFCAQVQPFKPSFRTAILQHPKERKNTLGTARLTHLCVEDSVLIPGSGFETDSVVTKLLQNPDNYCVVLYPGPNALDIHESREKLKEDTGDRKLVIFVVDGTWALAKGMLRRSPRLLALPQIRFTPERPSQYIVRRQPHVHCLSTIEAVHTLVGALDPTPKADILLDLFSTLVQQQILRTNAEKLEGTVEGKLSGPLENKREEKQQIEKLTHSGQV